MRAEHRYGLRALVVTAGLALVATPGCDGDGGPTPPPSLRGIAISVDLSTLELNQTTTARATASYSDGSSQPAQNASWSSSDLNVLAVEGGGAQVTLRGIGTGQATVTASAGGFQDSEDVGVVTGAPATVAVSPVSIANLACQATQQFSATVQNQYGGTLPSPSVAWSSSDPNVVTIDATGLATGNKVGTAQVTATANGISGSADITTVAGPPTSLTLAPASHTFSSLAEELQLSASGEDACLNPLAAIAANWSSSDPDVLPVTSDGLVKARDNGTATVTAEAQADPTVSGSGDYTVDIPRGSLQGSVKRQEDDSPVAGVEVTLTDVFARSYTATSAADGSYQFADRLAGPDYTLELDIATLPPITVLLTAASQTVEVVGNVTTDIPETVVRKANVPVGVAVSTSSLTVGDETEVTLSIDMAEVGPALGALTVVIQWSDAVLRYVAGSFESLASWDAIVENPMPGQLTVSAVSTVGLNDDVISVARFRLQGKATGSCSLAPSATDLSTIDNNGYSHDLIALGNVSYSASDVDVQ